MKNYMLWAALLLAACTSAQERAAQETQTEIADCTKAGYQAGTPAFDDCRLDVRVREEQKTADRIAAASSLQPSSHSGLTVPTGLSFPLP